MEEMDEKSQLVEVGTSTTNTTTTTPTDSTPATLSRVSFSGSFHGCCVVFFFEDLMMRLSDGSTC